MKVSKTKAAEDIRHDIYFIECVATPFGRCFFKSLLSRESYFSSVRFKKVLYAFGTKK